MSKLSRKEFKELLLEWKNNFINERGKHQSSFVNPERDFLSTPRDEEGKILVSLLYYLDDKLENTFNKLGINVLRKNPQNINLIVNFLNKEGYEKEANEIAKEATNDSALFITHDSGGDQSPNSIIASEENIANRVGGKPDSTWLVHDFVHEFIESEVPNAKYAFQDEALENHFNSVITNPSNHDVFQGGLYKMMNDASDERIAAGDYYDLVEALVNFFNEINFTPGVKDNDTGISAYAYCWMKMNHEEDFNDINNSERLNDREKELIKEYFKSVFPKIHKIKNLVLESFKKTIVIVPVL